MTPRMMMWMKARCGSDWFQHSATYRWLHCSLIIIITMMMMMIKDASTIFCIYFISYDLNMIQSHNLQLLDFPHWFHFYKCTHVKGRPGCPMEKSGVQFIEPNSKVFHFFGPKDVYLFCSRKVFVYSKPPRWNMLWRNASVITLQYCLKKKTLKFNMSIELSNIHLLQV